MKTRAVTKNFEGAQKNESGNEPDEATQKQKLENISEIKNLLQKSLKVFKY